MIVTLQKSAGNKGCRCCFPLLVVARDGEMEIGDGEAEPGCLVGCDWAPLSLFTHLFSSELTIKQ